MHRIDDGREGITKFVTEHRQEFVLAAVQVGQGLGLLLPFPLYRKRSVMS